MAGALAVMPLPATWVEQWYSVTFYPHIQRTLTPLSNQLPFAVFDLLLIVVAAFVVGSLARAMARAWRGRTEIGRAHV